MNQEQLALAIVGLVAFMLVARAFRLYVARPLAIWLLKQGKVKWAMLVRNRLSPKKPGKSGDCCH